MEEFCKLLIINNLRELSSHLLSGKMKPLALCMQTLHLVILKVLTSSLANLVCQNFGYNCLIIPDDFIETIEGRGGKRAL